MPSAAFICRAAECLPRLPANARFLLKRVATSSPLMFFACPPAVAAGFICAPHADAMMFATRMRERDDARRLPLMFCLTRWQARYIYAAAIMPRCACRCRLPPRFTRCAALPLRFAACAANIVSDACRYLPAPVPPAARRAAALADAFRCAPPRHAYKDVARRDTNAIDALRLPRRHASRQRQQSTKATLRAAPTRLPAEARRRGDGSVSERALRRRFVCPVSLMLTPHALLAASLAAVR